MMTADDLVIRQGDIRTIDAIMPVMQAAFDPAYGEAWTAAQCAGMMALPGTILFTAEKSNQVCGFALIRSVLEEAELLLIATHPEHRRSGIGANLCFTLFAWCRENGITSVFLEVRDGNPAYSLYSKLGFKPLGRRINYYQGSNDKKFDAVSLRFDLAPQS